jgi:glycosyltransferase involved in cell wall biosynthesis
VRRPIRSLPHDLFLTNSQAEITVLRRDYHLRHEALVLSVPNACDLAPQASTTSDRSNGDSGYLLYPGVFHARKNQLGFIAAMREFPYPVVFMGAPLATPECAAYYGRCRDAAPKHWRFLGHVAHGGDEFRQIMSQARVACLASSCETPGLALLEAAAWGARPAMTREGCGGEYFGFDGEYFNPADKDDSQGAVMRAWRRGRLVLPRAQHQPAWRDTAARTYDSYLEQMRRLRLTA